jgi:hypothetical protein
MMVFGVIEPRSMSAAKGAAHSIWKNQQFLARSAKT